MHHGGEKLMQIEQIERYCRTSMQWEMELLCLKSFHIYRDLRG